MNEGEILGHVPGPEEYEEIVELYEAVKRRNPQSNPCFWAWEMYRLGSIYGKRAERAKVAPVQQTGEEEGAV